MANFIDLKKEKDRYEAYDMGCGCCGETIIVSKEDVKQYIEYLERQLEVANQALNELN